MTFCRLFLRRAGRRDLLLAEASLLGRKVFIHSLFLIALLAGSAEPPLEQFDFFEQKIRPLFSEHCYQCHSQKAEKIKGGLRLDTREALLKGGDSGPIIVAGDPDASLLIKAVRYTDPDLQMPPKNKKLSDEQIANLEAWVKMGAPDPRSSNGPRPLTDIAEARSRHWAFQPVTKPAPPVPKNSRWVQNKIDNFILAALEKNKLQPAPAADRRTLIRRVTYDLIGLPPTWEEVEAFARDKRPDAYPRLVDRLLDSPHYGERWARYWLDVARFADTKGYLPGGEERRYPFSFTYRDYVVQAFNEDKPYDRFVAEQLAADLLIEAPFSDAKDPRLAEGNRGSLAALGFLTLGRRFLNNQNDIIDDRIDLVSRGLLGLTVACARCHDHKFDPIPTKDYYALHGVFASSEEPAEKPLLAPFNEESSDYQDYLKQKAKIEIEIAQFKDKEVTKFLDELRQNVGDYLLGAYDAAKLPDQSKFETFAGERKLNPVVLRRWMHDMEARRKKSDPIFDLWFERARPSDADVPRNVAGAASTANPVVAKAIFESATNSLKEAADAYTKLFKEIDAGWKSALEAATKENKAVPTALTDPDREALRQVLYAEGTAINMPRSEAESIIARRLGEGAAPFRNRIEALSWTHPGAPKRAMALQDRAKPQNSHVFLRGNPSNQGDEVPRHFLTVLSDGGSEASGAMAHPNTASVRALATSVTIVPPPFINGSGRLELARAIASPNNPLTARVYVNRLWLHHFGEGLVSTPGDFGVRTEAPVHRELLDFLAASFIEGGWSTKALQRLILLSATYQQSSDLQAASLKVDPENRLFSRMNRQRLDFEAVRDTLLAVAGKLDPTVGGLPVEITKEPFSTRRTLYALIDRQNLPALFRTFDFANPDTSSQRRFHTTVPQQALFLMNNPFVIEQARNLAQRSEVKNCKSCDEQIQALYHLVFQRTPTPAERQLTEKFLASQPQTSASLSPVEKFAQILLLSNELMFVD